MSDEHEDARSVPDDAMPGGESWSPSTSTTAWRSVATEALTGRDAQPGEPSPVEEATSERARSSAPADGRLPQSTARAITATTLLGAVALSLHEPLLGVGALAGILLGPATRRFTGGFRAVTAGAIVLPAVTLGLVAVVGAAARTDAGVALSGFGAVAGLAVTAVRSDVTADDLQQFGFLTVLAGLVVAVTAVASYAGAQAGGLASVPGDAAAGIFSPTTFGFLAWSASAALALVLALSALPPAAVTPPRARGNTVGRKLLLGIVAIPTVFVPLTAVEFLTTIGVSRAVLFIFTAVCATLAVGGVLVRQSWHAVGAEETHTEPLMRLIRTGKWQTAGRETNPIVGALVALHLSAWVALFSVSGTAGVSQPVPSVFGATAGVLLVGGLVASMYARLGGAVTLPAPATVAAAALVGGAVAVELLRTGDQPVVALNLASVGTVVAVAAGVFVYSAGRYGQTLAREVGTAGTTRQPQHVWLGWHTTVAAVGVLASLALFWASDAVLLVLPTPARAGLVAGFGALAALTVLLLRR